MAIAGEGGTVNLIQVTPNAEPLRKPFGAISMSADEVLAMLQGLANDDLDRAESHWSGVAPGVTLTKQALSGDAASTILDTADADGADMIVMASSGRGAIGRVTLGSVADKVVRTSTKPILVVREVDAPESPELPKINRVIVPLDGSDRAQLSLPVAAVVAKQLGAAINLITAVDLPQVVSPAMAYGSAFSAEFYTEIEQESTKAAEENLDAALAILGEHGATGEKHVMLGSAVGAILDFAKPGDMVVMTSRGQGGIKRWLLGSVAEKLIRECPAPVLIVPAHHDE
jgi:nucleotide-binding universal stress UspA family protein